MNTNHLPAFRTVRAVLFLLLSLTGEPVRAEQFGQFTYRVDGATITITDYPESASGHVAVPADIDDKPVTAIGDSAFESCLGLTSLAIPASVTSIGVSAFGYCRDLISITLPANVTLLGAAAFANCTSLISVAIPGVTSIGAGAFRGCTSLTSLPMPNSVNSIGFSAFERCTGLISITIPGSVPSINGNTFRDCTSLASIAIPASVITIGEGAFQGCSALTSISLPPGVSSLGSSAFEGCTSLASVTIPPGLTGIDLYTFQNCTGLDSVFIPDSVTTIGYGAFQGCTTLSSVTIPNSVTRLADHAFQDCTGLGSITLPDAVTEIGWHAFHGCAGLASLFIGSGLTTIGLFAFEGCTGLDGIEVSPLNPNFSSLDGVLFNKNRTKLFRYPSRRTGPYAIPNTVITIGEYGRAFEGCTGLTTVTIPASVTGVGSFIGCPVLTGFTVDPANVAYSSVIGVLFNKNRTTLLRYPQGLAGVSYTIPGTVTTIAAGAFNGCTGLTSVTIPGSVTLIGAGAFDGCTGLTSVTLPGSVTLIGAGAFYRCTGLVSIPIPGSVTRIDGNAFEGCTGLTSVTIPNSVTSIGYGAYWGCTGLATVSIGRGVSTIGYRAFYACTGLTAFTVDTLNSKYRSIDGVLFSRSPFNLLQFPARKAGHYSIPNGVVEVLNPDDPFEGCAALTSVFIPASVIGFNHFYFQGCSSLTSIEVNPLNANFLSLDGVLFRKSQNLPDQLLHILVRFPPAKASVYTVPAMAASIESTAFEGSSGLESVIFTGHSPGAGDFFADAAPGFTVYYFLGSVGFTSPTWNGYPAVMIDRAVNPAAEWLIGHGLPWNADLTDDPNGDGVSLLMAYALNLDPNLNLRSSLPVPVLGPQNLSLSFHGTRPGITYAAVTSIDLLNWTTAGVILSAPGPDGRRTASVARDGPVRYLRLAVAH